MPDPTPRPDRAGELRRRAEARLAAREGAEVGLEFELDVHRIELELQQEELQTSLRQLERAHDRYRELYEEAPVGYLTLDPQGLILEGNPQAAGLLGVALARLAGARLARWVPSDQAGILARHLRATLQAGGTEAQECELTLGGEDGVVRHVRLKSRAIRAGGQGVRTILIDLTRHRRTEKALLEERVFAERLVRTARAIVLLLDHEGRILRLNPYLEELAGRSSEELLGRDWFEACVPPWARWMARATFRDAQAGREPPTHLSPIVGFDGQERMVDWATTVLRDEELRSIGLLAIGLDVTERLAAERARARSEVDLQSVLETVPDAIVSMDEDGVIESFNPAAERIFGHPAEDVLGRTIELLIPAPFLEQLGRHPAEETGSAPARELIGRRRDGSTFPLGFSLGAREAGGRRHFTGVFRDLSERRGLEQELRHSQRLEAVGLLAGGLAHEYKNLLMGIEGLASMALEGLADSPARTCVAEVRAAAGRGSGLAALLLELGRPTRPQRRVALLDEAVAVASRLLLVLLGQVVLELDLGAADARVELEEGALELVLLNLALNARDAMPEGGRLVIRTRGRPAEGAVVLSLQDSGTGMDEAVQARLFEPFFTTKNGAGTGLGLLTVRRVVQQLGGRIEVESAPGAGSTFRVVLPLRDAAPAADPPAPAPAIPAREVGTRTVLVVEDERLVRVTVEHYLRRAGHRVLLAGDAEEALRELEAHPGGVDLLLVDVSLPGEGGAALGRRLRARDPRLAILFMSALSREQLLAQGALQADDLLLEKPFDEEQLAARVALALVAAGGHPAGGGP